MLFLSAVGYLDANNWSLEELRAFLLAQTAESGRLPGDKEFERRWAESHLYVLLQPVRVRAILEKLEKAKRAKFHETTNLADG